MQQVYRKKAFAQPVSNGYGTPALYARDILPSRVAINPLAGLTMHRVANYLSMAERGYYPDLAWLFRFVSKRDATLRAVRQRRMGALAKLDWEIKVKAGVDEKKAKNQQEALHEAYDNIDNLKNSIEFLSDADFMGFSHLEKHYDENGDVCHLEPVPQWYWVRRFPSKAWLYNSKSLQTTLGVEIDPENFIVREVDDPINEIATICFMRKNLSQKDWDGFIETFGIPPIFIELPAGVGRTEEYQQMADKVISDGRGVIGNGAKIVPLDTAMRGKNPFRDHLDYQDQQIVLAATGGLLTSLTSDAGLGSGGSGQASAHEGAFYDIAMGEAIEISECFQKQFDKNILDEQFPGQDHMVYFELAFDDMENEQPSQVILDAVQLNQIGYKIDQDQLEEKTGYTLEEAEMPQDPNNPNGDPNQQGGGQDGQPDPNDPYAAYGDWAQSLRNQKLAVRGAQGKFVDAIMNVAKTGDDKIINALEKLIVEMPEFAEYEASVK
jgi:phage gp29-like protein